MIRRASSARETITSFHDESDTKRSGTGAFIFRVVAFSLIFGVLQFCWQASENSAIERWVIGDLAMRPAAIILNWMSPNLGVRIDHFKLVSPAGTLNIKNGCDGTELFFLVLAGFCITDLSWRPRALGILVGCALVIILNDARIVTLYSAYWRDRDLFSLLHGGVLPITLVLLVALFFYAWLRRFDDPDADDF